jgi:hypothetical protein
VDTTVEEDTRVEGDTEDEVDSPGGEGDISRPNMNMIDH